MARENGIVNPINVEIMEVDIPYLHKPVELNLVIALSSPLLSANDDDFYADATKLAHVAI